MFSIAWIVLDTYTHYDKIVNNSHEINDNDNYYKYRIYFLRSYKSNESALTF